jgi:hypothetical protein
MPSSAKLIITAPANTSMAFASAWIKTQSVFKKYVRCNGRYDTSQAESFAAELRKAGCQVAVVATS